VTFKRSKATAATKAARRRAGHKLAKMWTKKSAWRIYARRGPRTAGSTAKNHERQRQGICASWAVSCRTPAFRPTLGSRIQAEATQERPRHEDEEHTLLIGVGTAIAYFLWRQANDPKRILAQGDAALTQAAALQAAGQPVPEDMKATILRAHGP